jgi:hypothetical protein
MIGQQVDLRERLLTATRWTRTGNPEWPWQTRVGDERWAVRLNDFPEEAMYTLFVDEEPAGDFNDWPERWTR